MLRFMAIRFGRALLTMFIVLVIAFLTLRLSGTPFAMMYPEGITAEHQAALDAKYGFDRPIWKQFVVYLGDITQGNFGRSLYTKQRTCGAKSLNHWSFFLSKSRFRAETCAFSSGAATGRRKRLMPRLTDARVCDLRAKKTTRNVRDTALAGFGVRILSSGRKRFFLHSQHDGQRIWKIVGDPADMTVAEARERARGLLASLRSGRPDGETLFETVAEEAFRRHGRQWKPSTLSVNRHYLDKHILPPVRGTADCRHHAAGCAGLVRRDARDAGIGGPVDACPVGHHDSGRGGRPAPGGFQPVQGDQEIQAAEPGPVPL